MTRGRISAQAQQANHQPRHEDLKQVFSSIPKGALVVSVDTDILFRPELQTELSEALPDARLVSIPSLDGHDGFLLEFEALGSIITKHLRMYCPGLYEEGCIVHGHAVAPDEVISSIFGEQEPEF